jgi:hypothetical protein
MKRFELAAIPWGKIHAFSPGNKSIQAFCGIKMKRFLIPCIKGNPCGGITCTKCRRALNLPVAA